MGCHVRKLNTAEKYVANSLQRSAVSYAQCSGYQHVDYTEFIKFRAELKEKGTPVSTTALFAKAMGLAMKDYPELNCILKMDYEGKKGSYALEIWDEVNVAVGVDTPQGLMLIVAKDVANKDIFTINAELKDMIARTREGKLTVDDMSGATITMSNLSNGILEYFTSAIVGDQAMILGFAGIMDKPAVENGQVVVKKIGSLISNMNHSATQGLITTKYTSKVKEILEHPYEYFL